MNEPSNFGVLDDLFTEALELTAEEQAGFIKQIAQDKPELARALERLLERSRRAQSFLGQEAEISRDSLLARSLESVHAQVRAGGLKPGDALGPYVIEGTIGRGLRSVVYLARREEAEWSQRVAIKVLARGVNTDDVHRRFLAERRILTDLRFPGISILLDGGVTDDGLPFFVMEYIDGPTITDFCTEKRLDLDDRIRLFRQVCEAVAHAHRHLVVHRDIKPSNILINAQGQAKLLDFGIAKLLEPSAGEAQFLTAIETRPMTPAYSSPEQEAGEPVTTATDVYQLGLLLAELLTGMGPPRRVLGIESQRVPERLPSQVACAEDLPYRARALRGDLDWIVLRALEPAPDERYLSAAELLADLERYQESLPVVARTWTAAYVVRKYIRRRPGMALAAALTAVALIGYLVMLGYFNVRLDSERQAAIEAATQAEETKDLLIQILTSPDPFAGTGADTRVVDLLQHSEAAVLGDFAHRPELQAELLASLADVYLNLTVFDRAITLREQELQARRRYEDPNSLPILSARRKLATARLQAGGAEQALQELNSVLADLMSYQPEALVELGEVRMAIGGLLVGQGATEDARVHLEEAIRLFRAHGGQPISLAQAMMHYAFVFDDYSVRLEHEQAAYQLRLESLGPAHPATLGAAAQIAATLTDLGRYQESLDRYENLLPQMEIELGPLHSETMSVLNNLAVTLYFAGELGSAIEQHRKVLERKRQKYGAYHPTVADSLQNIGALLVPLGRHGEAIPVLQEAAEIYAKTNLPGNPVTAYPHISLAGVYSDLDQAEELEYHARQAIELLQGNVADTDVALLKSQCLFGDALIRKGDAEQGVAMVQTAIEGMTGQTRLGPRHVEQCQEILRRAVPTRASP